MRKSVNVVAAVDIITMTKSMNTTMMKNAAVVAAVNITIMNMKLMSIIITLRKNVAVVVDIITTKTKSMNIIMKQWSMSLVLCRQV